MARDGHDIHRRVRCFGRQEVELLALIVDKTDVHLDAGFGLELFLEGVRNELVVGPDVYLAAALRI